ncbi:putative Gamma-glutamyltransferase [Rhodotorula taiwanensis]|uniref:Glutathione hydrolase n=1 Tax=Rhodotorula taiwanensis TaxID=741276 RepID=A0A2S5BCG3_9BASI|nr:putative Gamma-glutamyltransferase [Rhodotorula taiwanensis]
MAVSATTERDRNEDERSPLLASSAVSAKSTGGAASSPPRPPHATLSPPTRPSYRQRALSRASGNPLPTAAGGTSDYGTTSLTDSDADSNNDNSSGGGASQPLLLTGDEPIGPVSERDQAQVEDHVKRIRRRTWVRKTLVCLLLLLIVAGIVLAIVLPLTIGRKGKGNGGKDKDGGSDGKKGKKDTPDMTHLPPPKAGGRNPSYLVTGWNGAVASEEQRCSEIGIDILRENGTAVDAAIGTALCVGVVNSFSSGIGGGGFMVIRPPSHSRHPHADAPEVYAAGNPHCRGPISIDFRETAPSLAYPDMFTKDARPDDSDWDPNRASKVGGLSIGVPGELRGFEAAYQACGGGVTWERIFRPAAELAREFKVGKELHRRLNARWSGTSEGPTISEWIKDDDAFSEVFMRGGKGGSRKEFLQEGDTVRREAYAWTLEKLGREGASAFYDGEIADAIVRAARATGGILTHDDMKAYRAVVRPAEVATYRGRRYYTGSYPSGGPILQHLLNVLDGYKTYAEDGKTGLGVHRFVEALKFAFAARTNVGDPPFIKNGAKLAEIPTRKYADAVRANITDDRTHKLAYYNPQFDIDEDHGTTHLSVIDQWGGAVSLTTTVNLIFGSRVMDTKTGIILNDEMDDFSTPGLPDAFGLRPSPFNYPEGGKRPLSSTSPLIMDHADSHEVYLALGGSGGSRIFGAVAQTLLNLDWGYDLANAVEQPRVHHQLLPAYVSIESTFRPDLVEALKLRGHNTTLFDINLGIAEVQACMRDTDGRFFATSDSRKNGIPAAF